MAGNTPRKVWECPYWHVEEHDFTGPDGKDRTWYTAKRPNPHTVHILGITAGGDVPILRQWREPFQAYVWELPAGLCDVEGESMEDTALRELQEESGYTAFKAIHLFQGTVSPGLTDELYHAFLCLDIVRTPDGGGGTGGERIEVTMVSFWRLVPFLFKCQLAGELVDSKIITHWSLAQSAIAAWAGQEWEDDNPGMFSNLTKILMPPRDVGESEYRIFGIPF